MRINPGKEAIGATGVAFLLPPILSLVFRSAEFGSIGPTVLIYSIFCLIVFTILYSKALVEKYKRAIAISVGTISGIIMAVLVLNYFMLVTYLFGIMDYNAM
ncbi:MAG: hypothetical protein GY935_09315 [Gammaproteobacteria bacterium]|nr:hypothetical protein [Gammaproteobacteria bacterium]